MLFRTAALGTGAGSWGSWQELGSPTLFLSSLLALLLQNIFLSFLGHCWKLILALALHNPPNCSGWS